jgi:Domain of unknown function (DUF4304)
MRAQDLFRTMLRDQLAPELRRIGFKGSGQRYDLRATSGDVGVLGFQKDTGSTGAHVRFTANLMVVRASGAIGWRVRIGALLDDPHDHWWTIRIGDDVSAVTDHVLWLVRERGLPELRHRLGLGPPVSLRHEPIPGADCPWPFCSDDHRLWHKAHDSDVVVERWREWAPEPWTVDDLAMVRAALPLRVRRTVAWKILHCTRRRLDELADAAGLGDEMGLPALVALAALHLSFVDDSPDPDLAVGVVRDVSVVVAERTADVWNMVLDLTATGHRVRRWLPALHVADEPADDPEEWFAHSYLGNLVLDVARELTRRRPARPGGRR